MASSFDPYHMRPLATMNSRAVAALPGADILPGADAPGTGGAGPGVPIVGRTGAQLLSKTALITLIAPHAAELGLENEDPAQYPRCLNELLAAGEVPSTSLEIAGAIAGEFGRRLGCLVASIMLGLSRMTDPLDAWEAAYLRHWREEVREIVLGGGHATGALGAAIARAVEQTLAACGLADRRVRAAENPSYLALTGAARSLPDTTAAQPGAAPTAAVVADFGGTRAKSGVACYDARGRLAGLLVLPPRDISALTTSCEDVPALAAAMVEVMAGGLEAAARDASVAPVSRILCSVGAYVENGQPLNTGRGVYNMLNDITFDLKGWFSRRVTQACGREMAVEFGHDIDLAARSQAGREKCAVIMLGSHIGVGFVPPGAGYRELAEDFKITGWLFGAAR